MDETDRKIVTNLLAKQIGEAVSKWMARNGIEDGVQAHAFVETPTCYIDEKGEMHTGRLIPVNVDFLDEDDEDDD